MIGVDSELNLLHCTFLADNKVDWEAFLPLTDDQIRMLVKAHGATDEAHKEENSFEYFNSSGECLVW